MEEPLLSVIVPVYMVEPWLERCVDSIRRQTYRNLEIILVDDGSPDLCGEMCDRFAREEKRIRVIHRENGGLSAARNTGLDVCRGEYIGFVDSKGHPDVDAMLQDFNGTMPAQLMQAALMLVDVSYNNRAPISNQNMSVVPYTFDILVKPYVKL